MHVVQQNKIICPACNAELEVSDLTRNEITCEFCGSAVKVDVNASSAKKSTKKAETKKDTAKVPAKKKTSAKKKSATTAAKKTGDEVKPAKTKAQAKNAPSSKKNTAKVEKPIKKADPKAEKAAEKKETDNKSKTWTGSITTRPMSVILQDDLSKAEPAQSVDDTGDLDLDLDIVEETEDEKDVRLRTETEASYSKRIRDFRKIGEDATAYMTALDFADEYPGSFNAWRFLFEMETSPELRRSHLEKMSIVASTDKERQYLTEKAPLVLRRDQAKAQNAVDEAEAEVEKLKEERTQLMKSHSLMKPEEWKASIENELASNIQTMKNVKPQLDDLQAKQKSGSNPHIYLFMVLGVVLGGIIGFLVDSHPLTIFIGAVVGFVVGIVACLIFSVFFAVNRANKISAQMAAVQDYMDKLNDKEEDLLDQQRQCRRVFDIADDISALQDDIDAGYAEIAEIEDVLEKLGATN